MAHTLFSVSRVHTYTHIHTYIHTYIRTDGQTDTHDEGSLQVRMVYITITDLYTFVTTLNLKLRFSPLYGPEDRAGVPLPVQTLSV